MISSLVDTASKSLQGDQNTMTAVRPNTSWYFSCQ